MSWSDANGCKGSGATAVGFWGNDSYRRVLAEEEQGRQRALLLDDVKAGGIRSELWQPVKSGTRCLCYKESNQQSDRKCYSCHGNGYLPGFLKFGYSTIWLSGSDSTATMVNVVPTTGFKSSDVQIEDGYTIGELISEEFSFTRSAVGSVWEVDSHYTIREAAYSSVTIEYSLNSGSTWADIATLPTVNPVSGTIMFKATLLRDSTDVLSPFFDIVRARYATISLDNSVAGMYRVGPWILAMRDIPFRQIKKQDWGDAPLNSNEHFWTVGLADFDPSITRGSEQELITGSAFIEFMDGAIAGTRHVITSWQNSDPFAYILVSQTFTLRAADTVGPYSLVW